MTASDWSKLGEQPSSAGTFKAVIVAWTMLNYLALFLIVAAAAQLGTSHAFAWYTLCLALALVSSPIAIAYVFGLVFLDTWENRDAWRVVGCLAFLQPALATWTVLRQKQRWMIESTHLTVVPPVVSLVTRKTFFPVAVGLHVASDKTLVVGAVFSAD